MVIILNCDAGTWGYTVLDNGRVVARDGGYELAEHALGDALTCPTAVDEVTPARAGAAPADPFA